MSLAKFAHFDVLEAFAVPAGAHTLQRMAARTLAHRHQFDFEPRAGYIYVRSRAISSRCNDNFDMFPAEEIKKAYRTFVGKPVFVNHKNADHRRARGYIVDAALHEDTNPDGSPDTWAEVLMEVDAIAFPRLSEAVLNGDIARTSMGTDVAYSLCTACGNKAVTPADYCEHIPALKGMKYRRYTASGTPEEILIAEECHGLGFFENSLLVEPPADPTAYAFGATRGEDLLSKAASRVTDWDAIISESGRKQVTIKAKDIQIGDRLDMAGRTRVDFRHPRTDKVLVRTKTRGARSPSVAQWDHDDEVKVYREGSLIAEAGQCVMCNPGLSATGSTVLCDSHAFMRDHDYQMPSHYLDYPVYPKAGRAVRALLASAEDDWLGPLTTEGCDICGDSGHTTGDHRAHPEVHDDINRRSHLAYGETKAPAQVDTMRAEACPVCGDDEGFSGEKCNVCGYQQPPSQFRDPDLEKAKQQDLRQDKAEQQGHDLEQGVNTDGPFDVTAPMAPGADDGTEDLQCTNCGEVFSAEGQPEGNDSTRDVLQEDPAQATDPKHPDAPEDPHGQKVGPDGQPVADDKAKPEDPQRPDKPNPFEKKDQQEPGAQKPEVPPHGAPETKQQQVDPKRDPNLDPSQQDPAVDPRKQPAEGEGRVTPQDSSAVDKLRDNQPLDGSTCPVCGKGTLVPVQAQDPDQVQDQPTEVDNPNKLSPQAKISTASRRGGVSKEASRDMNQPNPAQQRRSLMVQAIAEQQDMIEVLSKNNGYLTRAVAALALAAKVDTHPAFAPIVRAAGLQRRADGAQNPDGSPSTTTEQAKKPQATDDVTSPGGAPSSVNSDVTPTSVTDVNNSNVADPGGADTLKNLQDVTAPASGTDAVYPAAATGEGKIEVGSPDQKSFDSTGPSWKSSAVERFTASLRLARLQIEAGIETGEDIAVSEKIASSQMSTEAMLAQADALKAAIGAVRTASGNQPNADQRRRLVPQAAARQGIQPVGQVQAIEGGSQPLFAGGLPTVTARADEDEWMIGDGGSNPLG